MQKDFLELLKLIFVDEICFYSASIFYFYIS